MTDAPTKIIVERVGRGALASIAAHLAGQPLSLFASEGGEALASLDASREVLERLARSGLKLEPDAQPASERRPAPRVATTTFAERVEAVRGLIRGLDGAAIELCRAQRSIGDFHFKTAVGVAAADCLLAGDALRRKLRAFNSTPEAEGPPAPEISESRADAGVLAKRVAAIDARLVELLQSLAPFTDMALEDALVLAHHKLGRDADALRRWATYGPTPAALLTRARGLVRDCPVERCPQPGSEPPRRLTVEALRDPAARAAYLSSVAYLEIASVDIVSDLVVRATEAQLEDLAALRVDLAMQLQDECRHAELLAARVEALGFPLGYRTIDLRTWELYSAFDGIAEKLAVQQVTQEGMGLDASGANVLAFLEAGDAATADLFAQISADEANHVRLGLRWIERLHRGSHVDLIRDVQRRSERILPVTPMPVVVGWRDRCGFPRELVEADVNRWGELSASTIEEAIGHLARSDRER